MTQTDETPEAAARRLAGPAIAKGFEPSGLHVYSDAAGLPWCWRIRATRADGEKWIRPMHHNGRTFVTGEPTAPPNGKPLYRLPDLRGDGVAFVVEGETCTDALAGLGLTATTSGSAGSADAADWSALRGRHVVIWRDNDTAGLRYAEAVTAKLRGIAAVIDWLDLASLTLPDKGDCVDWLALNPDATAADVLALARMDAPGPLPPSPVGARAAPEPLRRALAAPAAYPLDALGSVLGGAAARIHAVVQCPAAMCGQSILAAASLAIQAHADVLIDGRREPLSLWHVTVGESGERKSAADSWALRPHREHERMLADAYRHDFIAYEMEARAYKAATRHAEKKKDAAAIRAALADIGNPPLAPLQPLVLLSEPTLEGLHKLYQSGRPSLGLFNDDAGDFLAGHAMSNENRTKSAAGFSRLWDNGEFSRVRSGDGAAKFFGRRLALHVMVQPVIAESVLSDDVLTGQGFLARCLMAWPESTIGMRAYVEADLSTDPAMLAYWACIRERLRASHPLRTGTRNELEPRTLELAPDAKARWIEIADAIEGDMAGDFADVKAWASKGGAQILRIAAVLTLIDNDDADVIRIGAIGRAARLTLYHLSEAARIVGTASTPPRIRHAEALLDWCRDTGRPMLYSSDALRKGPKCIRTADTFTEAVGVLEGTGWADYVEGGAVLDGKRRAKVWQVRIGEVA